MQKTDRHTPEEIDAYLEGFPDDIRAALLRIRSIIRETAPGCTERVGYGIPIFRLGKDLLGMSAQKNHCSLHSMSPPLLRAMTETLADFETSGATIHFTPEKQLPKNLIETIVRERMKEVGLSA